VNFEDVFDHLVNVAQVARKVPTPTLRGAYVRAMREWCRQTQWLRTEINGSTVAEQQAYDLGSDPYLEVLAVLAVTGVDNSGSKPQTWPIYPGDPSSWNANREPNRPGSYTYVPEAQIALFPVPDKVYGLGVTAVVQPKAGAVQIPASPLVKYGTTFEAGALAYLLAMRDTPWHDPASAALQLATFRSGVSNGKAEVQRNFNTGSQRVRPRAFLAGSRFP
jgi:hypothetical protein